MLGKGSSGSVYLANDLKLNRQVALKIFNELRLRDSISEKRFQNEAKTLSKLNHKNIVKVFRFGFLNNGLPFIVMEYVQGDSLRNLLLKEKNLNCQTAFLLASDICQAMIYAHSKGLIHRDLKPENIFVRSNITDSNRALSCKILDFGLCKEIEEISLGSDKLTSTGFILGTPAYLSPELCLGQPADLTSDIYAFGCILFEMILGDTPFVGNNFAQLVQKHLTENIPKIKDLYSDIPIASELDEIINKCTAKNKSKRFQDFQEIYNKLQELIALNCNFKLEPNIDRTKSEIYKKQKHLNRLKDYQHAFFLFTIILFSLAIFGISIIIFEPTLANKILSNPITRSLPSNLYSDIILGYANLIESSSKNDWQNELKNLSSNVIDSSILSIHDKEKLYYAFFDKFNKLSDKEKAKELALKYLKTLINDKSLISNSHLQKQKIKNELHEITRFFTENKTDLATWKEIANLLDTHVYSNDRANTIHNSPLAESKDLHILFAESFKFDLSAHGQERAASCCVDISHSIVDQKIAQNISQNSTDLELAKKYIDLGLLIAQKDKFGELAIILHYDLARYFYLKNNYPNAKQELNKCKILSEKYLLTKETQELVTNLERLLTNKIQSINGPSNFKPKS